MINLVLDSLDRLMENLYLGIFYSYEVNGGGLSSSDGKFSAFRTTDTTYIR